MTAASNKRDVLNNFSSPKCQNAEACNAFASQQFQ
jgi:hypothetical protein